MKTTNLYKVTYFDHEAPSAISLGAETELWIGANSFEEVLAVIRYQEIADEDLRNIEFVRSGVVIDNRPRWHVTDFETGVEHILP